MPENDQIPVDALLLEMEGINLSTTEECEKVMQANEAGIALMKELIADADAGRYRGPVMKISEWRQTLIANFKFYAAMYKIAFEAYGKLKGAEHDVMQFFEPAHLKAA